MALVTVPVQVGWIDADIDIDKHLREASTRALLDELSRRRQAMPPDLVSLLRRAWRDRDEDLFDDLMAEVEHPEMAHARRRHLRAQYEAHVAVRRLAASAGISTESH